MKKLKNKCELEEERLRNRTYTINEHNVVLDAEQIFYLEKKDKYYAKVEAAYIKGLFVGSISVHLSYCGWSGPTSNNVWGTLQIECCESYEELRYNLLSSMYRGLVSEFCSKNSCRPKNSIMFIQELMDKISDEATEIGYRPIAKVLPQFITHLI